MTKYKNSTLTEYLIELSAKTPVPGGGSACALVAGLAAGLIEMVAHYSVGKGKPVQIEEKLKEVIKKSHKLKKRFLHLVDLDAAAYLKVTKTRKSKPEIKEKALAQARAVPQEVSRLCYEAVQLTPVLVKHGNPYLRSDVLVALQFLEAAYRSAKINVETNQSP